MLYVVTAVHNRKNITNAFIERLLKQSYKNWRLLIIDDGSTDGTSEMILDLLPDANIIKGNGNLWWGGALQKAYQWLVANATDEDLVYTCNDDIIIPEDFLKHGVKLVNEYPNSMVTGTGYSVQTGIRGDGAIKIDFATGKEERLDVNSVGNAGTTRSLFFTVRMMKKIGGFHPVLLPHYWSDLEYVIRAAKKGFPVRSFDNLVYQYDETSTGIKKKSLKTMFSKRSVYNPAYYFNYLIMTTPIKYLPGRLMMRIKKRKQ